MYSRIVLLSIWLIPFAIACNSRDPFYTGDDPDPFCQTNPSECPGEIGGRCAFDEDCAEGVCCRDGGNCAGGMCLYQCVSDLDCPGSQACEHGFCFFRCSADVQCGPGQKCEHDDTICEYD